MSSTTTSPSELSVPLLQTSSVIDGKSAGCAALPPGPRRLPGPAYRLVTDPVEALANWREQFGPTFTVSRFGTKIVFTGELELIRQIHAANDPDLFAAAVPGPADVLLGTNSLLLATGQRHSRERKLMMPAFHGERMRAWAEGIADIARRGFGGVGETQMLELAQRATLEVILRVVFGVKDASVAEFASAILAMTNAAHPSFLFLRCFQRDLLGLSPYARFRTASERVNELLDQQIAQSRADLCDRTDVLADLLRARYDDGSSMDDATVRDQLRTLLVAGHETTSLLLTWAVHFVLKNPEVLARLREELVSLGPQASANQLARLPYLGAVVDETLRIRPFSADTYRLLNKPWQLGKWRLPAGTAVAPSPLLVHFDPEIWPDPLRFSPERFLNTRPRPNTYLPFGGGMRRCLGATFARFEACILLGTLMREKRISALDQDERWVRGKLSLQPANGVRIRLSDHR